MALALLEQKALLSRYACWLCICIHQCWWFVEGKVQLANRLVKLTDVQACRMPGRFKSLIRPLMFMRGLQS
jgi:hypothetical protein